MSAQISRAGRWLSTYADLLVDLHLLMARNEDEGSVGDVLRDQMDSPWQRMTPEEIRMVRDLSIDLYGITDPPAALINSLPREIDAQISRALKSESWVWTLQIVRENADRIPRHIASFLRGYCWSRLGLHKAAAEFFRHAIELQPEQLGYRVYALCSLIYSGQERAALPLAEQWITDSSDRLLLLTASNVLFVNAELAASEESNQLHRLAIDVTQRALQGLNAEDIGNSLHDHVVTAYLHMAMSLSHLGDLPSANAAWRQAVRLAPDSLDGILVGGLLNQSHGETSHEARLGVARQIVGVPLNPVDQGRLLVFPLETSAPMPSFLAN